MTLTEELALSKRNLVNPNRGTLDYATQKEYAIGRARVQADFRAIASMEQAGKQFWATQQQRENERNAE